MKFLFVHNNFPGQFLNLASDLSVNPANIVKAIGTSVAPGLPNVAIERYRARAGRSASVHPFARHFDMECRNAEQVLFAASALAASGFVPDLIFVHCGWGESLPLRAVFPKSKIAVYCEFYFKAEGQDVHFDPEAPTLGADAVVTLQCRNATTLLALAEADLGIAPTHWQRSVFPSEFHSKIKVAHEGIDTERAKPNDQAKVRTPSGRIFSRNGAEIVTFVVRSLEPMRGYHILMRALPIVLQKRPRAEVIIVGNDDTSYGPSAPSGTTWKDVFLRENSAALDLSRIHFMGRVSYNVFLSILQLSSVHVYLTYPFVLSWSLLEAMSTECRIVASDTAPLREVIDAESGVLVPFFDIHGLADAIIDILANPRAYSGMGARARQTAAVRFDKRHCIPRLKRILGID
jgi:glycosyltransferase involved in cell wall biosynthesis